jgi:hypothetical protein
MSARTRRPLSRRIQQRVFRVLNVPMRAVLGLPFATPLSGRLMLVFSPGAGPASPTGSRSATSATARC